MFDKDRENLPGKYQYAQGKIIRIKTLILTNLFPKKKTQMLVYLIPKHLKEYKKLGVEFRSIPLAFEDSIKLAKFLRSVLERILEKPLEQYVSFCTFLNRCEENFRELKRDTFVVYMPVEYDHKRFLEEFYNILNEVET